MLGVHRHQLDICTACQRGQQGEGIKCRHRARHAEQQQVQPVKGVYLWYKAKARSKSVRLKVQIAKQMRYITAACQDETGY